ncbi:GIY-YIG nuclease family protein [Nocardioides plantarum]|uniref:GIY-YIG nuclease family protein n=1 Tax=Nocardioides plantarum TaxID=29299 RepID=A0ABV5K8Q7_9ACTN|nr:GIY-YIG nuclease family protein [Nocardioides plantarum]
MAWTYILECRDGSYYVGSTIDLERRVGQHRAGEGAAYTRHRLPVELVWAAQFSSVRAAYDFEKRVQGWGRAKRQALINGREDLLPRLASRCWAATHTEAAEATGPPPQPEPMPWDVPHERVDDPHDPWSPLRPLEPHDTDATPPPYTRIVADRWSRDRR